MRPMDEDIHRLEAKGLARAKIRSKRRRVQMIRRRTIRGSLALFAVSWAIVFGQLVTGNDPALSRTHNTHKLLASTHRASPAFRSPGGEGAPVVAPARASEEPSSGEEAGSGGNAAPGEEAVPSVEPAPREEAAVAPAPPVLTSAS
jgi:hypothetical protein